MKYTLDTNTLIYFFKGIGNVALNLLSTAPSEIGVSSLVLYELEFGIAVSTDPRKRQGQLQELVSLVTIIPFRWKEAKQAAQIRAALEKKGAPIGPYDVLIAATAISNNAILVTHNKKEFQRVHGLKIADWF